jgi:hypothetical protein
MTGLDEFASLLQSARRISASRCAGAPPLPVLQHRVPASALPLSGVGRFGCCAASAAARRQPVGARLGSRQPQPVPPVPGAGPRSARSRRLRVEPGRALRGPRHEGRRRSVPCALRLAAARWWSDTPWVAWWRWRWPVRTPGAAGRAGGGRHRPRGERAWHTHHPRLRRPQRRVRRPRDVSRPGGALRSVPARARTSSAP